MMPSTTQRDLLELQAQVWKARAHAKQKLLERRLAEPTRNPREAERRTQWIKHALTLVKRWREEIKFRGALLDAYAEHLSVLEMSLIGASEQKPQESSRPQRRDPARETAVGAA
jgi:hypothetical protein